MLFRQTGLICEDALVQNDMNEVLNDKLGTSQVNYPSNKWADNVSVLGEPLPMKTASGNIAHFTDGAKNVPLDTGIFYFTPVQASGTPTPSSPIAIYGHTGLNVVKCGVNLLNIKSFSNWDIIGNAYAVQRNACPRKPLKAVFLDKDTTVDLTGCYLGFVDSTYESGSLQTNNYRWIINNGTVASILDNYPVNNDTNKRLDGLIIYPRTEETYNKILARFDVMCVLPTETATTFEAYKGTTYPVSWTEHGTIFGGYYNSVTGELWKTWEGVDLSTIEWTLTSNRARTTTLQGLIAIPPNNDTPTTAIAEKYTAIAWSDSLNNHQTSYAISSDGTLVFYYDGNTAPTGIYVYELATPVLVAVIDPTKIKTFEGVNNIWNDGGGISEVGYRAKASGGGGIPTFIETTLAEDTGSTGTLDFAGADYHDYELIKCYLKNTATSREFEVLVTPQSLDDMFQYFGNGICFNQYGSNIFAYYDTNASGNWVKGSADRLICTKVCGLTGQGFSINVTNLYRKQATQSTSQAITTQLDLNDFDCIIASANNNTSDCVPCCYVMSGIVHNESLRNQMPNVANAWANAQEIVITEHEISSYNWFCVDAIKFE